jgi:hypothetical protein
MRQPFRDGCPMTNNPETEKSDELLSVDFSDFSQSGEIAFIE